MTTEEIHVVTAISCLAFALTGKVVRLGPQYLADLIGGKEFYLPDGGYSRIVVSELTGKARLTDNSRDPVKRAWEHPAHATLIALLENTVACARRKNHYEEETA